MLRNILGNWLNKTSKNDDQAKVSNLPKHEQAKLMVERIANLKGRRFNPIKAASINLQSINIDILSFIDRIELYAKKMEQPEGLTPQDCFSEMKTITLDNFFTDTEGMYISMSAIDDFIASCRRLFVVLDTAKSQNRRDLEYSLRLMIKCFTSIINVCKAMEEARQ